jgi:hypothetical protein
MSAPLRCHAVTTAAPNCRTRTTTASNPTTSFQGHAPPQIHHQRPSYFSIRRPVMFSGFYAHANKLIVPQCCRDLSLTRLMHAQATHCASLHVNNTYSLMSRPSSSGKIDMVRKQVTRLFSRLNSRGRWGRFPVPHPCVRWNIGKGRGRWQGWSCSVGSM